MKFHSQTFSSFKDRFCFWLKKACSKTWLKRFWIVLSPKEKVAFCLLLAALIISSVWLFRFFYFSQTKIQPAQGGVYTEGALGQPRFINPVLASSDIDRDLSELIYSGLMKYNQKGEIVPDLAESYKIRDDGRTFEIVLKENLYWHDGKELTADDVVFTIKTIQNPEYKSPELTNWIDVEVEKISRARIIFRLNSPYFPFLERLTLKILPQHLFSNIQPENFFFTSYNLEPIGSGPFYFKELEIKESTEGRVGKIISLALQRNPNYHDKLPYLEKLIFRFYDSKDSLYQALKKGEVQGTVVNEPQDIGVFKLDDFNLYEGDLPRYFAVFFNPEKNELLGKPEIRQALGQIEINRVLEKILSGRAEKVTSPILPEIYGFTPFKIEESENRTTAEEMLEAAGLTKQENGMWAKKKGEDSFNFTARMEKGSRGKQVEELQQCLGFFPEIYSEGTVSGYFGPSTEQAIIRFQERYKEEILEPWGFSEGTGIVAKTTQEKLNEVCNDHVSTVEPIVFTLVTVDQPFLLATAKVLQDQWKEAGLEVKIKSYGFMELSQEVIKPRQYEMLLFGEMLGLIPDPFPFWHSSRIQDPGLNLSLYQNKEADKFLEKAREANDLPALRENLESFQNIIVEDQPALFLFRPKLIYAASKRIQGIELGLIADPSKRFSLVENWYLKTERKFK